MRGAFAPVVACILAIVATQPLHANRTVFPSKARHTYTSTLSRDGPLQAFYILYGYVALSSYKPRITLLARFARKAGLANTFALIITRSPSSASPHIAMLRAALPE